MLEEGRRKKEDDMDIHGERRYWAYWKKEDDTDIHGERRYWSCWKKEEGRRHGHTR